LNFKEWDLKKQMTRFTAMTEQVAALNGLVFLKNPLSSGDRGVGLDPVRLQEPVQAVGVQNPKRAVVLDEQTSLAGLFSLFDVQEAQNAFGAGDVYPGLFTFTGGPKLYRLFKKPFRIRVKSEMVNGSPYVLIREVTPGGALAVDEDGNTTDIPNDVLLEQWDGEMSWIYPYEYASAPLRDGMQGLGILKVQHMLRRLGYSVPANGIYGSNTADEVARFQLNYGLRASGVVGTPTKALLYQIHG
jgi:hypothetical protein